MSRAFRPEWGISLSLFANDKFVIRHEDNIKNKKMVILVTVLSLFTH